LKLNGTHQLLAYANDVNILEESVHTVKENAEALVDAVTGIDKCRWQTIECEYGAWVEY
jgi:hypothetical protein